MSAVNLAFHVGASNPQVDHGPREYHSLSVSDVTAWRGVDQAVVVPGDRLYRFGLCRDPQPFGLLAVSQC